METQIIWQPCTQLYLGNVGIADLCHDVTDELQHKEPSVQTTEIEFIFHVIVYDLSSTYHVL